MAARAAYLVAGTRTPFALSGTQHAKSLAADLGRMALKGLLVKAGIDATVPDYVVMGTVIQEVRTSNIARESALAAGLPDSTPAHTVTMACISSSQAAATGAGLIATGQAEAVVVGGAETMSDVPIRFSRAVRQRMLRSQKARGVGDYLALLRGLRAADLAPELPAIAEYSTGEVMGASSDRLAAAWGVGREDQDAFALRSHLAAARAHKDGILGEEITPVGGSTWDNTIKPDSTAEKLASLKPAFHRPHGTHTAGNSSPLTDGASAALLMSEAAAARHGLAPVARIVDSLFVSQDPKDELLLGPAYAISRLLARNGLALGDVDAWELHEAFAGQVLANLNALDSDVLVKRMAEQRARRGAGATPYPLPSAKLGRVPLEKVNPWGGSLSLGHPFGATGTRLLTTAGHRLTAGGGRYAVLAACAAGGQGHAMLLERVEARPAPVAPRMPPAGPGAPGSGKAPPPAPAAGKQPAKAAA